MKRILFASSLAALLALSANAANISWQTPQLISGAADVSTLGTYFGSWAPYGAGANLLPVNGVTFHANDLPGFTIDSWFTSTYNGFGDPGTPDSNYNSLLQAAQFSNDGTAGSFTWSGMTPGDTYEVQLWAEDTRNIGNRRWENAYGDEGTAGQSAAINFPADGTGLGNYVIGTFVAGPNGTQTIGFSTWSTTSGAQCAQVNLFQVRDLTVVPEPSMTELLAGCGLLALGCLLRRQSHQDAEPSQLNN